MSITEIKVEVSLESYILLSCGLTLYSHNLLFIYYSYISKEGTHLRVLPNIQISRIPKMKSTNGRPEEPKRRQLMKSILFCAASVGKWALHSSCLRTTRRQIGDFCCFVVNWWQEAKWSHGNEVWIVHIICKGVFILSATKCSKLARDGGSPPKEVAVLWRRSWAMGCISGICGDGGGHEGDIPGEAKVFNTGSCHINAGICRDGVGFPFGFGGPDVMCRDLF